MSLHAQSIDKSQLKEKVQSKLNEIYGNAQAAGVTFAYSLPDGSTEAVSAGWANKESQEEMKPLSRMLGGSTGKVFYSVVAMQLIEEGKLGLDTKISIYLKDKPWFARLPNAQSLTIRNLMRHSTGIPRYVFAEAFQTDITKDADKVWAPEELVGYVLDEKPLFEAGKSFAYSDTNYIVLCMIIEEVTGNDLYKEVEKRVLKKAGLKYVSPQNKRKYKGLAQGYNGENDPFFPGKALDEKGKSRYNLQFEWAGGGLVINSHDLAKLGKLVYEGKMFNPALLEEFFDGRDAGRLGGKWGLGVHIRDTPANGRTFGHSGFMPGYITNMIYFEQDKFSICYQVNSSTPEARSIMRDLPELANMIREEIK